MSNKSIQPEKTIQEKVNELEKKFLLGYENSQLKSKKGIVFIGNSRIGKSTISATISGIKMHIVRADFQFKIEPEEEKYRNNKNIIQHRLTSVTQFPNIYTAQINGQEYTVVDLPGFRDTSYEKELCNWHYIKSILSQLNEILFFMVIQVHSEAKNLEDPELQMMERFAQAFPSKSPNKPKENLVTIVNFIDNIKNENHQNQLKAQIKQNILAQIKKSEKFKGLENFYSKNFNPERLFLMERAKNKNSKENVQFNNPKLMNFIKENISKMEQTQLSNYKINLTNERNKQSQELRKVIAQLTEKMIKNIGQKFLLYKKLFFILVTLMSETSGICCQAIDYQDLDSYYRKNEIKAYESIAIQMKQKISNNFDSREEIACQIVFHLKSNWIDVDQINSLKKIQLIKQVCDKFIELMQALCEKTFSVPDYERIQQMSKAFRKSIHIQCQNLLYLCENVENFHIRNQSSKPFQGEIDIWLGDMYRNKIRKMEKDFKQLLQQYFKKLIDTIQKWPIKKINLDLLQKMKGACACMDFNGLKKQIIILAFKTMHKKLHHDLHTFKNLQIFYQYLDKVRNTLLKNDELAVIEAWKKTNDEWNMIKNKGYIQILKNLKNIGYNTHELVELYLKIDGQFEQVVELLRMVIKNAESEQIGKSRAFDLCIKACEHMQKYWQYNLALTCCDLAKKLYIYEYKEKTIEAKMKSIQIKNLMRIQLEGARIKAQLQLNPWINVSDAQYNEILNVAHISKELYQQKIQEEKKIEMQKTFSSPQKKSANKDSSLQSIAQSPDESKKEEKKSLRRISTYNRLKIIN